MNEKLTIPKTAKTRGRIAPVRLAHIVFKTPQFKAMVDWWCTVLEAKPAMSNDNLAFLTYDEEHHRVAIVNMPTLLPTTTLMRGLDHIAFTYASLSDLLATWKRLDGLGIKPVWCTNHGPTTSIYYADPDGNKVELQVENFDTPEEILAWSANSDFETNPIGVDFEPTELYQRLESGEPESALKQRPVIGPRGVASIPREMVGSFNKLLARFAGK